MRPTWRGLNCANIGYWGMGLLFTCYPLELNSAITPTLICWWLIYFHHLFIPLLQPPTEIFLTDWFNTHAYCKLIQLCLSEKVWSSFFCNVRLYQTISKVILEILYFLTNLSRCHRFLSFPEKFDIFYEKLTRELCESVKENCWQFFEARENEKFLPLQCKARDRQTPTFYFVQEIKASWKYFFVIKSVSHTKYNKRIPGAK